MPPRGPMVVRGRFSLLGDASSLSVVPRKLLDARTDTEQPMRTIDTSFDFRSDSRLGRDPDSDSPTLRRYHRLLWSKPLPSGRPFELVDTRPGGYLYHRSDLVSSSCRATQ